MNKKILGVFLLTSLFSQAMMTKITQHDVTKKTSGGKTSYTSRDVDGTLKRYTKNGNT